MMNNEHGGRISGAPTRDLLEEPEQVAATLCAGLAVSA